MTIDHSFKDLNRSSRERIRALAERLTDTEMQTRVGEHWTIGILFAHLAWWDQRVIHILEITEKNGALFALEIDTVVNDLSLPLWSLIPPREAARLALETSETLDKRLEEFSPSLLEAVYNHNKRWVIRALHRNEHLDEADAALGARDA